MQNAVSPEDEGGEVADPSGLVPMHPVPSIDEIRAAVLDQAVAVSYEVVVKEFGMARSNLTKFLHGARPRRRTLARMTEWYVRHYDGAAPAPLADVFGRLGPLQLAALRFALKKRIERTSQRAVARAVGMSSSGLQKFLGGSTACSVTVEKLLRWHTRETGGPAPNSAPI